MTTDTILVVARGPLAGARFKAAAALPITGSKRRKLLCLIAAYQDAGHAPSVRQLAERIDGVDWRGVDALLKRLVADGWIEVRWAKHGQRNHYELRFPQHATTYRSNEQ